MWTVNSIVSNKELIEFEYTQVWNTQTWHKGKQVSHKSSSLSRGLRVKGLEPPRDHLVRETVCLQGTNDGVRLRFNWTLIVLRPPGGAEMGIYIEGGSESGYVVDEIRKPCLQIRCPAESAPCTICWIARFWDCFSMRKYFPLNNGFEKGNSFFVSTDK